MTFLRSLALLRSACALALVLCLATVAWSQATIRPAQPSPTTAPVDTADRVVSAVDVRTTRKLGGWLPSWVAAGRVVGAPAPELRLERLTVLLSRSVEREQAFRQRLADQQDPASAEYHHWLTPDQIGQQYGPTQHDLDQVKGWLSSQGLEVEQVSKSRTVVTFSGTVAQVEAALGVHFARYGLGADEAAAGTPRERLSIAAEPRVPAALAPVVQAFGGLSQIPVHPYSHAEVRRMSEKPQFSYCNSDKTSCEHFITPQDFATIFDLAGDAFTSASFSQRIAIIGRSRVDPADVTAFINATNGYENGVNVLVPLIGSEPGTTNDGDQLEATIDVTRVLGTAPNEPIDLIVSGNSETQSGIYTASLFEVDTVLDPVMNISFGACEADAGADGVALYDNLASQAAGEGISVFVSSGDAGAAGCDQNNATPPLTQVQSPNYICSTSYVTCVGGTEFNDSADSNQYWSMTNSSELGSATGYIPEGGWNEPTTVNKSGATVYQASASGGGPSSIILKPSWQTGTGVPADGFRDTPDVAFPSSAHDGYFACAAFLGADCSQGYFAYVFGTSAAAPAMAGITAVLDELRSTGAGNFNPTLYSVAANTAAGAFHDATVQSSGVATCSLATPSMCNNSTPSPTGLSGGLAGYALTDGYDLVTGLGSLDAQKFVSAAFPVLLTPTLVTSPTVIDVTTSQSFPLVVTVSGSGPVPGGTVTWAINGSAPIGAPVPVVSGVATLAAANLSVPGTYTLLALYSGDAFYAAANATQLVGVAPAPGSIVPTIQVSASTTDFFVEQPVVFSAAVAGSAGTPTGSVQFLKDQGEPLGAPVPLVNGMASSSPQMFLHFDEILVSAQYSGDAQYQGVVSGNVELVIASLPAPGFQISAATLVLKAGQATSNTATISVASQNNYNDTITFTCMVSYSGSGTANDLPTCTLGAPGTLALSPATPNGTLTATISTIAPSGASGVFRAQGGGGGSVVKAGFPSLFGLLSLTLLASSGHARRSGLFSRWMVMGLLLAGLAGSAIGCGGGTTASSPTAPVIPGTTSGSYLVTVVGASRTFTSVASFTLIVQ